MISGNWILFPINHLLNWDEAIFTAWYFLLPVQTSPNEGIFFDRKVCSLSENWFRYINLNSTSFDNQSFSKLWDMLQNFILNVNSMKYVVKHTCFLKMLWMVEFERSVMFTFAICREDKFIHLRVSCICMFWTAYIPGTF